MRTLVTGATGFLGRHLVAALRAEGRYVRALVRAEAACRQLSEAGVEVVRADLRDAAGIATACAGMDVVQHVGALSAPWGRAADFHAINVRGTANVIAGCRQHRVRRLVFVSSPSVVFDGRDQTNVTEAAPYPARYLAVYSHTKKLAEDLVNQAACAGLETVILRPKALFGPGDTSLLPRVLRLARAGRLPQIGDGKNLVDLTYVDNVVHALKLAATSQRAVGKTYHITNGEHVAVWDLIRLVLRHFGLDTRLKHFPYPVAYALAAALELRARCLGGEPRLTRYTAAILGRTQTYDITNARRELDYEPLVDVNAGVSRTLEFLAKAGTHA
jgi:nucleoside-diphosphate-sugar epimerase